MKDATITDQMWWVKKIVLDKMWVNSYLLNNDFPLEGLVYTLFNIPTLKESHSEVIKQFNNEL